MQSYAFDDTQSMRSKLVTELVFYLQIRKRICITVLMSNHFSKIDKTNSPNVHFFIRLFTHKYESFICVNVLEKSDTGPSSSADRRGMR